MRNTSCNAGLHGDIDIRLVHCCDVDGNTFDCAFRLLDFTDMEDHGNQRYINNARDTGEVTSFWPYLSQFNKTYKWYASWFLLRETSTHTPQFIPAIQDYIEFGETAHRLWWGGQADIDEAIRPRRKRRRGGEPRGGDGPSARGRGRGRGSGARRKKAIDDAAGGDSEPDHPGDEHGGDHADAEPLGSDEAEAGSYDADGSDSFFGSLFGDRARSESSRGDGDTDKADDEMDVDGPPTPAGGDATPEPDGDDIIGDPDPGGPPDDAAPPPPADLHGGDVLPIPEAPLPPPPPPPPPPGGPPPVYLPDGSITIPWDNGTVSFYTSNRNFFALCGLHSVAGVPCCLTRTSNPGRRKGQGRPLGLLSAWLQDPDSHAGTSIVGWARPSFDERVTARAELEAVPGSEALFEQERPPKDGEGDEPPHVT